MVFLYHNAGNACKNGFMFLQPAYFDIKSLAKEPHFGKYVFIYNFLTVALPELIRLQHVSELLMSLFSCQGDNNS